MVDFGYHSLFMMIARLLVCLSLSALVDLLVSCWLLGIFLLIAWQIIGCYLCLSLLIILVFLGYLCLLL